MQGERTCQVCGYTTSVPLADAPVCPRCGLTWSEPVPEADAEGRLTPATRAEVDFEAPVDRAEEREPDTSSATATDSVHAFLRAISAEREEAGEAPEVVITAGSGVDVEPLVVVTPDSVESAAQPVAAGSQAVRPRRRREHPQQLSWVAIIAIYLCGAMTGFVIGRLVYGPAAQSPLRKIPDYGVRQGGRQWVLPDSSAAVPRGQWLKFDRTTRIGDLEVRPLRIFVGRVKFVRLNPVTGKTETLGYSDKTLVLALRIRNVSDSLAFSPLDELFLRPSEFPAYSYIELPDGEKVPMYPLSKFSERNIQHQSFDELAPGEEREYWIAAHPRILKQMRNTMVWRLQLRVGGTPEETYATVVALEFSVSDVERKQAAQHA